LIGNIERSNKETFSPNFS